MKRILHDVQSIYKGWDTADTQIDWADENIVVKRLYTQSEPQPEPQVWTGRQNLGDLAANAWSGQYPKWRELVIDCDSLLV